jgi:hypothetical protein
MAWANTIQGTTDPNNFNQDSINWCQFNCNLVGFRGHFSGAPWVSNDGATGTIALKTGPIFYSNKQGPPPTGVNWVGNFPSGMGVIYNGFALPPFAPAGIRITFDSPVEGVGAYIQGSDFGPFTATITLFGQIGNSLGSFTADGFSCSPFLGTCKSPKEATALFIGAYGVGPIFGAQFDAIDSANHEDFAIGILKSGPFVVPEPSSLLLFASSALGVGGVIRRRSRGVL